MNPHRESARRLHVIEPQRTWRGRLRSWWRRLTVARYRAFERERALEFERKRNQALSDVMNIEKKRAKVFARVIKESK